MSRWHELVDKRAALTMEGQAILDSPEGEDGGLSAAQAKRHDEILALLRPDALLAKEISRIEAQREADRAVLSQRDRENGAATSVKIGGVHDRREDDPRGGFAGLGEFALAVRAASTPGGGVDERLLMGGAPTNYLERGGANGEGFLIPAEFRAGIWQLVFEDPLVAQFNWEPTASGRVELMADQTTPWGASGVTARWRVEASQMTPQTFGLTKRSTETDQLYAFVLATNELLRDAPLLDNRIRMKASEAIAWAVGEALIRGTGAGQPRGILTSGVAVEVAKEGSQAADSVVAANIAKMYSRLLKQPGGRAFWIANDDVLPSLISMTIGDRPVWLAPNGLVGNAAPGGTLFGLPVYTSEHADTIGDVGDLILVNSAGYHAIRRTDSPEFASSIHLYFDYNMTAFRWTFEIGGQPFLTSVITPPNSAATKSHFVTLAART